ncbi:hypothetical protein [Luteimonas lutimaris]|uniref:Rod shape-determining protein MreD n=1 Tax=Luteimonas lutimaris TaxID=698645 RepID=A0ABP7M636_9GAMM
MRQLFHRNPLVAATLVGGAIGGTLDLAFAVGMALFRGDTAADLLRTVASGALGRAALDGGAGMAALGLGFHFALSWGWAALIGMAVRDLPDGLAGRPLAVAMIAGTLVFLVMRQVVLPLSGFPFPVELAFSLPLLLDWISHMFLFALPMVLAARRTRAG